MPAATEVPAARSPIAQALREAAIAALIAFGLFLPLIGFRTVQNIRNELVIDTRFGLLAIMVALVAGARLAGALVIEPWLARRAQQRATAATRPQPAWRAGIGRHIARVALGFVVVFPVIVISLTGFGGATKWIDNFGIQILIYVMLGWGLNIVVGLAGLLDLGYVAFYAVGAYSYALLATNFGFSFWLLLPLSESSPHSGAFCSAFRFCVCVAIISPSSRWRSAKSSAWC